MRRYPDDADGDALQRVADHGSDMSKPMLIDFMVAVPSDAAGRAVATEARTAGFTTNVSEDEDDGSFTCYCSKTMVATYDSVIAVQDQLDELSRPHEGRSDGWGTLGNVSE